MAPLSRRSSATTAASSTTPVPARSSLLMGFIFVNRAPTLPPKTVKLSALFVPLIISFALYYSKRACLLHTGLKHSPPPHTSLTFCLPKCCNLPRRTLPFMGHYRPMITFAFSVANVTLTFQPLLHTSWLHVLSFASSLATQLIIRDTAALTSTPTECSSRAMSSSTRLLSLSLSAPLAPPALTSWMISLILSRPPLDRLMFCLVQDLLSTWRLSLDCHVRQPTLHQAWPARFRAASPMSSSSATPGSQRTPLVRSPPAGGAAPATASLPVVAVPPPRELRHVYSRRRVPPPAGVTSTPPTAAPLPRGAVPVLPVTNQHPVTTRAKRGIRLPAVYHAAPLSPLPKTFRSALADPNWRAAMEEEHAALLQNHTWDLVPRPPRAIIVSGKWVYKHKFQSDGSLERYKARWVLWGFTQRPGVDFAETFSPVVKPATVRTVLSLALSRGWLIH